MGEEIFLAFMYASILCLCVKQICQTQSHHAPHRSYHYYINTISPGLDCYDVHMNLKSDVPIKYASKQPFIIFRRKLVQLHAVQVFLSQNEKKKTKSMKQNPKFFLHIF